jgi:hypothetical protein
MDMEDLAWRNGRGHGAPEALAFTALVYVLAAFLTSPAKPVTGHQSNGIEGGLSAPF